MAGLDYSALFGTLPSEEQYLAKDPFFAAGSNIGRIPQQQYTNPWAAFLMPVAQGLASGAMTGYGRENAADTGYQDYRSALAKIPDSYTTPDDMSPAVAALSEERPEGWTFQQGRSDLITKALAADAIREKELQGAKIREEITKTLMGKGMALGPDGSIMPLAGFAEAEAEAAGLKKKQELAAEGPRKELEKIPAAMLEKLSNSKAVVEEARFLASDLENLGTSWADLQKAKAFAGMDKTGVSNLLSNLADKLGKARSGASLNATEKVLYDRLIQGDATASPAQISNLLRKLADAEGRFATSQLELVESGSEGIAGLKRGFAAPPVTKVIGGKTYVKVNGGWQAE